MGTAAKLIEDEILKNLPPGKRLFKTDAGASYQGEVVKHNGNMLVLKNPRKLVGFPKGWFDLTGWETVEVTQEMVGKKIAVFVGEEVKAGKDTVKEEQEKIGKLLEKMGGFWRIIRG